MLQSFKVLMMSYKRPLWSTQCICKSVWAGLKALSIVIQVFFSFVRSGLRACDWTTLSSSPHVKSSSATMGEREEIPWWLSYSGLAIWSSQLIQNSAKTACNCSSVSSWRFFVCSRSLDKSSSEWASHWRIFTEHRFSYIYMVTKRICIS